MHIYTEFDSVNASLEILGIIKNSISNTNEMPFLRIGFDYVGRIVKGENVVFPIIGEWNELADEANMPFWLKHWSRDDEQKLAQYIEEFYLEQRTGFNYMDLFFGFEPDCIGGNEGDFVILPRHHQKPIQFSGKELVDYTEVYEDYGSIRMRIYHVKNQGEECYILHSHRVLINNQGEKVQFYQLQTMQKVMDTIFSNYGGIIQRDITRQLS